MKRLRYVVVADEPFGWCLVPSRDCMEGPTFHARLQDALDLIAARHESFSLEVVL